MLTACRQRDCRGRTRQKLGDANDRPYEPSQDDCTFRLSDLLNVYLTLRAESYPRHRPGARDTCSGLRAGLDPSSSSGPDDTRHRRRRVGRCLLSGGQSVDHQPHCPLYSTRPCSSHLTHPAAYEICFAATPHIGCAQSDTSDASAAMPPPPSSSNFIISKLGVQATVRDDKATGLICLKVSLSLVDARLPPLPHISRDSSRADSASITSLHS